jgi:hypothetical protein
MKKNEKEKRGSDRRRLSFSQAHQNVLRESLEIIEDAEEIDEEEAENSSSLVASSVPGDTEIESPTH